MDAASNTFYSLKKRLYVPTVPSSPCFNKPFRVETDMSSFAVGSLLSQKDDLGLVYLVKCTSQTMNTAEGNCTLF